MKATRALVLVDDRGRAARPRRSCRRGSRRNRWARREHIGSLRDGRGRPRPPAPGDRATSRRSTAPPPRRASARRPSGSPRSLREFGSRRAGRGGARARQLLVAARRAERARRRRRGCRRRRGAAPLAARPSARSPRPRSGTTSAAAAVVPAAASCRAGRPGTSSPRPATATPSSTLVFVAHHDAAHWRRCCSTPALLPLVDRLAPALLERSDTLAAADGAGDRRPAARRARRRSRAAAPLRAGTVLALGSAATFAEIGARDVVPGANDNLTGVATLLGLATELARAAASRACACCSSRPARRRASWRACRRSRRRHFPDAAAASARTFVCVDTRRLAAADADRGRGHAADARLPGGLQGPRRGVRRASAASICAAACGCATRPTA